MQTSINNLGNWTSSNTEQPNANNNQYDSQKSLWDYEVQKKSEQEQRTFNPPNPLDTSQQGANLVNNPFKYLLVVGAFILGGFIAKMTKKR
jgi:hypothetical protein